MTLIETEHPVSQTVRIEQASAISGPGSALRLLADTLEHSSDIWINFGDGTKAVLYHDSDGWMIEGDGFIRASGTRLTITDGPEIGIALESDRSPVTARFGFPASAVRSVYKCTDMEGMVTVFKA